MPVKITIELSDQAVSAAERLIRIGLWGKTLADVVSTGFERAAGIALALDEDVQNIKMFFGLFEKFLKRRKRQR